MRGFFGFGRDVRTAPRSCLRQANLVNRQSHQGNGLLIQEERRDASHRHGLAPAYRAQVTRTASLAEIQLQLSGHPALRDLRRKMVGVGVPGLRTGRL